MVFHYIPSAFHCDFSNVSLGISLLFFIRYSVHFIVTFHSIFSSFHCGFSNVSLGISLWSFKCSSGYFIAHFIWMPGAFNDYFIDSWPVCSHALFNLYYGDRLCKTIPYIIHRQKEKNGELVNRLEYLVTLSTDLVEFRWFHCNFTKPPSVSMKTVPIQLLLLQICLLLSPLCPEQLWMLVGSSPVAL